MARFLLCGLMLGSTLLILGCPQGQQVGIQGGGQNTSPAIIVRPSVLAIPSGGVGEFSVALSADPGEQVTVVVLCITGRCGFTATEPFLFFDSYNFSVPQIVVLTDIGFQSRGVSVLEVRGGNLEPALVTVIRN